LQDGTRLPTTGDGALWRHGGNLHPSHGKFYSNPIDGLPLGVLYLDDHLRLAWEMFKC
jgi:hypothetical protein